MSGGAGSQHRHGYGYVPVFSDAELRLGIGPTSQSQKPAGTVHKCSLCRKTFSSLQALGGHQTAHRKEMEEIRRKHEASVGAVKSSAKPACLASLDRGKKEVVGSAAAAAAADDLGLTLGTIPDSAAAGGLDLSLRL